MFIVLPLKKFEIILNVRNIHISFYLRCNRKTYRGHLNVFQCLIAAYLLKKGMNFDFCLYTLPQLGFEKLRKFLSLIEVLEVKQYYV